MHMKNERIEGLGEWEGVKIGEEVIEKVNICRYLGMDIGSGGGTDEEVNHRVSEGVKVLGGLKKIWNKGRLSRQVKVKLYERLCVFQHYCMGVRPG